MPSLNDIIAHKRIEVEDMPFSSEGGEQLPAAKQKCFLNALKMPGLSIIAEIKRHSPSKGLLADIDDVVAFAKSYQRGGASAISVLTDERYFHGSADDLQSLAVANTLTCPLLRKDFIIDKRQIEESVKLGADAILLIVAVLGDETQPLYDYAVACGLDVLVEVHDQAELEVALSMGADIIGINNRNLNTFETDIETCLSLIKQVPPGVVTVAESGMRTIDDIQRVKAAGFDGVLIGETLVTHAEPEILLQQMKAV